MPSNNLLFSQRRFGDLLRAAHLKIQHDIEQIPSATLLGASVESLCDHLEDQYRIDPLVLHEDRIEVDTSEADIDVRHDPDRFIRDRSRPHYIKGLQFVFHVPFSGDAELFKFSPSTILMSPPRGIVGKGELLVAVTTLSQDGAQVQATFDSTLSSIKMMVEQLANDAARFNAELRSAIRQGLERRREKVLADQKTTASLKYPVRKRAGQAEHIPVPVTRRKIRPLPTVPTGTAFKPEHAVSMEEYEEILKCIGNMAVAMERSPSSFAHMHEEQVRDFFLVLLNSQFEGAATGETFNFSGKTDILIRVEDRNVFIAECKFWHGEKAFVEAIDQLLGYACWRDTKLALLVFNRNKNLSAVIEKIGTSLRAHPNFIRDGACGHETSVRCTLRHRDDPGRELTLTVVVFEMPVDGGAMTAPRA